MINTEFGIASQKFRNMERSMRLAAFDDLVSIGIKWIRVDIDWWLLEQQDGSWNWAWYDNLVSDANSKRLKLDFILLGPPSWLRLESTSLDPKVPPSNYGDFAAYALRVVQRYAPLGVKTYEIYNEPNNNSLWTGQEYAELLKVCYPVMKAIDKNITILAGGSGNIDQLQFYTDMYQAEAKNYFDAIAHHPYTFPNLPPNGLWANISYPYLRKIMIDNDDGPKKIWLTEFGAPTGGTYGGQVTEEKQAQIYEAGITEARNAPYVQNMFFYTYQDFAAPGLSTNIEDYFGIKRYDGTKKPSYYTIKHLTGR